MYLTYEEYQNMGGTLDETTFSDYAFEASSVVDWYTFNRLQNETTYPEALTKLMYRLINILQLQSQAIGLNAEQANGSGQGIVSSQSNDGVSISYNIIPASELAKQCEDKIKSTIKIYLSGLTNSLGYKLLYRGLYPGE